MDFGPNVCPVEVIKKGTFGDNYFRNIYSGVHDKFYKSIWKDFKELESIDKICYSSDFYDATLNKYGVECGTSLIFWEKKDGLIKLILMVGFSGILDTGKEVDLHMIEDRLVDGKDLLVDLRVF